MKYAMVNYNMLIFQLYCISTPWEYVIKFMPVSCKFDWLKHLRQKVIYLILLLNPNTKTRHLINSILFALFRKVNNDLLSINWFKNHKITWRILRIDIFAYKKLIQRAFQAIILMLHSISLHFSGIDRE